MKRELAQLMQTAGYVFTAADLLTDRFEFEDAALMQLHRSQAGRIGKIGPTETLPEARPGSPETGRWP